MKYLPILLGALMPSLAWGQVVKVPPRTQVPREVLSSAKLAVQGLADRVVRGEMTAVIDKMYPEWKKKEALKAGGVKKLELRMLKALKETRAQGVNLLVMQSEQPISAWEVNFGLEERVVNGQKKKVGVYRDWMVFVPTVSIVRAINEVKQPPEIVKMRMEGFQIAISKKGSNQWTFMDGSQVKAFQLRQLFPYLPADDQQLGLPRVGGKIIK